MTTPQTTAPQPPATRPKQLSLLQTQPVEIYVQSGRLGRHATTRGWPSAWAAHANDDATAVYRCALKYYWGGQDNGLFLYEHFRTVTITLLQDTQKLDGATVWRATVEQPKLINARKRASNGKTPKATRKARKK